MAETTTKTTMTFAQSFSNMTKNIVNNLMTKLPNVAIDTLTQVTQQKLAEKYLDKDEPKKRAAPAPAPAPQPQVIVQKAGLPSWALPVGIAAAGLGVVYLISQKKRRRR